MKVLAPYYEGIDPEFQPLRDKIREILQLESDLSEIVQLVGKDSLAESDKLKLEVAKIIKENFLQQNSYTPYDRYCPFYKTRWMIKNIVAFYSQGEAAIEASTDEHKITWATIRTAMGNIIHRLNSMKFENPDDGEEELCKRFRTLNDDIAKGFREIRDSD